MSGEKNTPEAVAANRGKNGQWPWLAPIPSDHSPNRLPEYGSGTDGTGLTGENPASENLSQGGTGNYTGTESTPSNLKSRLDSVDDSSYGS